MDLKQARVVVTGGGSGIGKATAQLLVAKGARVAILGRTAARLEQAAKEVGALAIVCDVSDEAAAGTAVQRAARELGCLNVLVNNAGSGTFAPLVETRAEDFERTWRTNVLGAFLMGRECAKAFGTNGGAIVNVGSTAARRGFAGGSAYCASKYALSALSDCWRAELRGANVRVMQVDPSEVQNDFGKHAGRAARTSVNPTKLESEHIARAIVALLELDDRSFVPGLEVWATNPR